MKKNVFLIGFVLLMAAFPAVFAQENDAAAQPSVASIADMTGWTATGRKSVECAMGNLKVFARPRSGSFNFYIMNENEKYVPLLSVKNESSTSAFFLKAGKSTYKLNADSDIKTYAKKTDAGIMIMYKVQNVADVVIDFAFLKSLPENDYDLIKVTATVVNRGKRQTEFSLKAVFDTVLGETDRYHFYSSANAGIKSETAYRSMQEEKWILSKNENAALQFILYGADATAPDLVALANYSTLDVNTWEPNMLSYRSFDTVLSYNNSAVGIFWPAQKLAVDEGGQTVFYLSMAADEKMPQGNVYVETLAEQQAKAAEEARIAAEKARFEAERRAQEQEELRKQLISKTQLSPDYIQALLNKIAALEEDDDSVSRQELLRLNAELDAILKALEQ